MPYTAQEVCEHLAELLISSHNINCEFSRIDGVEKYHSSSLIFVSNSKDLQYADTRVPAIVVTDALIAEQLISEQKDEPYGVIAVSNVRLAQALIKQQFFDYDAADLEWDAVHPSAVVHPSVTLGPNVRVGPNSVIGKNAVIGSGTQIRANCVIEHDAIVGENCIINNLVNIGYSCRLGDRVIIRAGVIIGNEGFGFAQDEQRHYHRISHTGIVDIQDDVQIGANSNIDRATYGKTLICRGVKIDALCHIAHNVVIGEDSLFVAQSGIAGSSNIGKRVVVSGQSAISDHKTVGDDAILVHRCGVTEDIPEASMWAGTPAKPFKEYVRNLNLGKKLARLESKLNELSIRLDKQ